MEKQNYIIETERLKLRELTLDDTDKLALVLSGQATEEGPNQGGLLNA